MEVVAQGQMVNLAEGRNINHLNVDDGAWKQVKLLKNELSKTLSKDDYKYHVVFLGRNKKDQRMVVK